jgi:hypothetical protein
MTSTVHRRSSLDQLAAVTRWWYRIDRARSFSSITSSR